jgi:uncharacterized membrane protein
MNWFFIALMAPFLWSITNLIDKILLSKYFKGIGVGSIIVFVAFADILILPFIYLFNPQVISLSPLHISILITIGILGTLEFLLYFKALAQEEASIVIPLFQLIPVFTFALGYIFLKESLTINQIFASIIIVLGTILISLNFDERIPKLKAKVLMLMVIACLIIAFQAVLFKVVAIREDYWSSIFWMYLGGGIAGIGILATFKSYRSEAYAVFKANSKAIISLTGISELTNLAGGLVVNYAFLLAPVTLVYIVNGFQPVFVFLESLALTLLFPQIYKESILKKHLLQKIFAIGVIFIGTYLLNS